LPKFLINWQNQLITLLNYPALTAMLRTVEGEVYGVCGLSCSKSCWTAGRRTGDWGRRLWQRTTLVRD